MIASRETVLRAPNCVFCIARKFLRTLSQRRSDLPGAVAAFSVGVVPRQISGASRSAAVRHYLRPAPSSRASGGPPGSGRSGLRKAGLPCRHEEWTGGHDHVWWQQRLAVALGWLLRA